MRKRLLLRDLRLVPVVCPINGEAENQARGC